MIQLPRLGRSISSCDTYAFLLLQFRQDEPDVSQEKLQQIVLIKGSCPTALWKGNAGSLKIAKAHFRYFRVFFLACWPVFVKLGTRGRLADSCIATYYVAPKFPDKSPPAKSPFLRPHLYIWWRLGVSFLLFFLSSSSPVPFFFLPINIPFLFLGWADEVCEETVGKHIANACQCQAQSFSYDCRLSSFTARGPRKRLF